jgi:hypothetical protein
MRRAWCAAFAAAVALGAPVAAHASAVTDWNRIATDTLVAMPGPAGGAPPALQINIAMTQGAVYDAVNAITPKHWRPYLLNRRFGATSSKDLAAATAAYTVLSKILDSVPPTIPFGNKALCRRRSTPTWPGCWRGFRTRRSGGAASRPAKPRPLR